jgi:acyl-CoA-dependent ceramide synthase
MPFPDHINAQILNTLSTVSGTISSAAAPIAPVLAPFTNLFATFFPDTANLISHAPEKLTTFFNTPSDFASIGPYELNWMAEQYKCWISQYITFGLLMALQLVNMFWFYLILRILWRLLISMGQEVEDVRSEDSEEAAQDRQDLLDELRKEQGDAFAGETGADIGRAAGKPELLLNGKPVK